MASQGSIGLGADQLLLQAEKLLLEVTGCIKPSAPRNVIRESQIVDDLVLNSDHKSFKVCDPESDLAQIEWLLRGVPEAYDSEPHMDDEMVMALLKEGGSPPKQLVLPSIYATNQLVLEKLSLAKLLRISLTNLLVLSVRYGVRKEGTFLRVYPPNGCNLPANEAGSIMIPLPELKDPSSQIGQLLRKNDKRDSLRNYFVGAIDLKKSYELELTMSEKVVREWIHSAPTGTLRIELHGYLAPHATAARGTLVEAMPLASAVVPLGGLLGTPSLDAVVHCDLTVDAYTHAMVLSRMRNLSFGQNISKQTKTLGPKLGTVTVRVSILAEHKPSAQSPASDPNRDHKLLHEVQPLMMPVPAHVREAEGDETVFEETTYTSLTRTTTQVTERGDRIHSALAYVPTEHPHNLPGARTSRVTNLLPLQTRQQPSRSVYGPNDHVNGVFALALCGIEGLSIPIEKAVEIKQAADSTQVEAAPRIVISFKISARNRETVSKELDFSSREQAANYDLLQGKVYYTDMLAWAAPVMEVWLCWTAPDLPPHALSVGQDPGCDSERPGTAEHKYLLGLARYPANYKLGSVARLPISDAARGVRRGVLVTAAVLGKEETLVETSLQCLLNFHTLDRRGTENATAPSAGSTQPAESSAEHSAHHTTVAPDTSSAVQIIPSEGVEESKQDVSMQDVSEEGPQHHSYELDDSIGDIISFLNDRGPQEFFAGTRGSAPSHAPPRQHPLSASTSSINEFLAQERDALAAGEEREDADGADGADDGVDDGKDREAEKEPVGMKTTEDLQEVRHVGKDVLSAPKSSVEGTRPTRGPANLHLLDFSVDGVFSAVRPTHSAYSSAAIFGCFVKYSLPDLNTADASSATAAGPDHALWWDGDCAVLNGSLRHQIELNSVSAPTLSDALGLSSCIKFFLHLADAEGNIPADSVVLGEASLQLTELAAFINDGSGFAVISLPVSLHHAALPRLREKFEVVQLHSELHLKVSHRIEPVLMRKSLDPARFAVEPALSPSASIDQPPWRLRYMGDDARSVQDAFENDHHAPVSPTATHKQPSLLGFELTQQDLDGMMYFRDPSAPLPWVPFEALDAAEAASRPVLTSALGGRAITAREGTEVDLDAALKKSIYELEYIGGMFGHRAEPSAPPLPPSTRRGAQGDGVGPDCSEDEADNDTGMYKSDFESLDEDVDTQDIAQFLEHDVATSVAATAQLDESGDSGHSHYFSDAPPEEGGADSEDSDAEEAVASRVAHLKFLISEHFKHAEQVSEDTSLLQGHEEVPSDDRNVRHDEIAVKDQSVSDYLHHSDDEGREEEKREEDGEEPLESPSSSSSSDASLADLDALMQGVVAEAAETFRSNSPTDAATTLLTEEEEEEEEEEGVVASSATEETRLRFDSPANFLETELDFDASMQGLEEEYPTTENPELEGNEEEKGEVDASVLSNQSPEPSVHVMEVATQTEVREVALDVDVSFSVSLPDLSLGHRDNDHDHDPQDVSSATSCKAIENEDENEDEAAHEELAHIEPSAHYSVHFSVHTDPDASNNSAFHESAADLSALSSASGLNRSVEVSRALETSRDSAVTAPSNTHRLFPGEEQDDSPDTSKIKNIVDKQIERFFGAEVLTQPVQPASTSAYQHVSHPGVSQPGVNSVHQWWSRIDSAKPSVLQPSTLIAPPAAKPPSEAELFRANLSKVQALLPAGLVSRGGARKHPGWQGRFLDKETDRASNIMNSVFNKSDHM